MARTTPSRARRSRAEVQDEFERLQDEVKETKKSSTAKDGELEKLKVAEVHQAVEGATVESEVMRISTLNLDISKALADVSAKLTAEVDRLGQLRNAVALETNELGRLHKLDIAATALDHLVEDYRLQREKLEAEITSQRASWAEERQTQSREQKDFEEALKKQRQREAEDFEYKKALERKKAQDKYDEELRLLEKRNAERQEALEKSWNLREVALKEREDELNRYQREVEAFPTRLKEERERSEAEASAATKRQFDQQLLVLRKDAEAEKRVSELRVKSLEEVSARQASQIEVLSRQLEEAKKQVQDIAVRAIEGASGAKALAHINQIAMEQAKTRIGQG